jgi:hypothetical protein
MRLAAMGIAVGLIGACQTEARPPQVPSSSPSACRLASFTPPSDLAEIPPRAVFGRPYDPPDAGKARECRARAESLEPYELTARVEWERAYLFGDRAALFELGVGAALLRDDARARASFREYLTIDGIPADRRRQAEAELAKLDTMVAWVALSCREPGREIFLDEVVVARCPVQGRLAVNPGRRRLGVSGPGACALTFDAAPGKLPAFEVPRY